MTSQFQVGRTYTCRSMCDYDCIYSFKVVKRTDSTITIRSAFGERRRKVRIYDGREQVDPLGRHSMSPVLTAA